MAPYTDPSSPNSFWQSLAANQPMSSYAAPTTPASMSRGYVGQPQMAGTGVRDVRALIGDLTRRKVFRSPTNSTGKIRSGNSGSRKGSRRKVPDRMSRKYKSFR